MTTDYTKIDTLENFLWVFTLFLILFTVSGIMFPVFYLGKIMVGATIAMIFGESAIIAGLLWWSDK